MSQNNGSELDKMTKNDLVEKVKTLEAEKLALQKKNEALKKESVKTGYLIPPPKSINELHALEYLDWKIKEENARLAKTKDSLSDKIQQVNRQREITIQEYEKKFVEAFQFAEQQKFVLKRTGVQLPEDEIKAFRKVYDTLVGKFPNSEKKVKGF